MAQNTKTVSLLEIYDLETGTHSVIKEFPYTIEAPNWTPDGKWLVYNSKGILYKLAADGSGEPVRIDTGSICECNNDHVISADGSWIGISSNNNEPGYCSYVFRVPFEGGEPVQVTPVGPSYLHGISPDGKSMAYCAFRTDKKGQLGRDVYTISSKGGKEKRLTTAPGLNDGPEYSPDGKYIWFNCSRTGTMQVWRMKANGKEQTQMTFDTSLYAWFPHVSPDGEKVVYICYHDWEIEPEAHLPNKHVELWLMAADGGAPAGAGAAGGPVRLVELFGGQGTINVNSWAPDSKRFAYVSYRLEEEPLVQR